MAETITIETAFGSIQVVAHNGDVMSVVNEGRADRSQTVFVLQTVSTDARRLAAALTQMADRIEGKDKAARIAQSLIKDTERAFLGPNRPISSKEELRAAVLGYDPDLPLTGQDHD